MTTDINSDSMLTLHDQVEKELRRRLQENVWKPNQKISSEAELCKEFQISRGTLRDVISKLVYEGLLRKVPGKGTYVCESRVTLVPNGVHRFTVTKDLFSTDEIINTLLGIARVTVGDEIASRLCVPAGTECFTITTQSFLHDTPIIYGINYMPCLYAPSLDKSIYDLFGKYGDLDALFATEYGIQTANVDETLESIPASPLQANILSVKKGYPLLLLTDSFFNSEDTIFRYSQFAFRGDRIRIHIHL